MSRFQAKRQKFHNRSYRWTVGLVTLSLLMAGLTGCFGAKQRKSSNRAPGSPIVPADVTGRWKLSVMFQGSQADVGLVEIRYDAKQSENPYTIKLLGLDETASQALQVQSVKVSDTGQLEYEIQTPTHIAKFVGNLVGESFWGSYFEPNRQFSLAKMDPTDVEKLAHAPPAPIPGIEDYQTALNSFDPFLALKTFAERSENSPLLFDAYDGMAKNLIPKKLVKKKPSRSEIDEFIAKYRKAVEIWGSPVAFLVDLHVGHALALQGLEPELAQKLLEAAEPKVTSEMSSDFAISLIEGWILLDNPDRALKRLPELREKEPTNTNILWLYARAKEKAKETDEAMLAYIKVTVTPGFEQQLKVQGTERPIASALRLWKAKNNNSATGFDALALKAYPEVMQSYVPKRTPEKPAPDALVTLIELFTGAGALPCIGSDVGLDALRSSYSTQEVIVLKYHQHDPTVDPLANSSSKKRMDFYHMSEIPAMTFNGHVVEESLTMPNIASAPAFLASIRHAVDTVSKRTAPVAITLEAVRKKDEIRIKADVSGIKTLEHLPRLYLALVENDIHFPGVNGIFTHNCVVRAFAGSSSGIALPKGTSSHFETISLPDLKLDLLGQMKQFEAEREFPLKPMDFRKLQVVAFVQATHTQIVMQSKLVDVTGDPPPEVKSVVQPEAKNEAKASPEPKPEEKPVSKPDEKPSERPAEKPAEKSQEKSEKKD